MEQMMTAEQIFLVQATWADLELLSEKLGERFYTKLFERLPEVKPLFSTDAHDQGVALMSMLGIAVNMLDRLDRIGPTMQALKRQHERRGVKPEYYLPFREILMDTMRQVLGAGFTPQVHEAWIAMLDTLAAKMEMYTPTASAG
jgi:methyl-accepting chemotaxis protein